MKKYGGVGPIRQTGRLLVFQGSHSLSMCVHKYRYTCIYVCVHIHTYIFTSMHACTHALMDTIIHVCMHARMHTYIQTYIHAIIDVCMLARMHNLSHLKLFIHQTRAIKSILSRDTVTLYSVWFRSFFLSLRLNPRFSSYSDTNPQGFL